MKHTRISIVLWAALAMLATLAGPTPLRAQDNSPQPEMDQAMAEMMAAWQAYAAVGPEHEALQERVGDWEAEVSFWYAPGTPAQVSVASSTVRAIMGGRYIVEDFSSTMPDGSDFKGMGMLAYDNFKRQFVAMWVDTMSSGILFAESTSYEPDYSQVDFKGQAPDPMSKSYKTQRSRESWRDENTRVMEAWETGPDGTEFKVMEIVYTRK